MDDLISRAAAIAEVEQWAEHGYDVIHWTGIKAMLEVLPAVDAVPVVRCRDCKWFDCKNYVCNNDILAGRIADCGCYPNFNVEHDWFCADGERRDDDE